MRSFIIDFLRSSAAAHTTRMNCDEMSGETDTATTPEIIFFNKIWR